MKMFNKILLLSLTVLMAGFVSCNEDDDYSYTPGETTNKNGDNIYFASDNESSPILGVDDAEFKITVTRDNSTNAQTIPLEAKTAYDGVFTVPSSVSFDAGVGSVEITIGVTEKMQAFKSYLLEIIIPEEYTSQYEDQAVYPRVELNVLKEDFKPYAVGTYDSDFFGDSWSAVLEYSEMLDEYRFSDCWISGYDVTFSWNGGSSVIMGESVFITGYVHSSYGMVSATPVESSYDDSSKMFTFLYKWTVSAGSFGNYADTYTIQEVY
ncbi:MAG: hypothetical protein QM786_11425 [Breznakibacter sp.]